MSTKKKGKTVPCEGCRERKKKCTAGQPCERCKRLGIKCYYLKPVPPPKLDAYDSVNNQEIQFHVEFLEDIMRNMERELYSLKSPYQKKEEEKQDNNNIDSAYSDEDYDTSTCSSRSIASSSTTSSTTTEWQLTFRKGGGITINTDILSYASLLKHIQQFGGDALNLLFPLVKQPTLVSLSTGGGYLFRQMMSTIVRKGHFKIVTKSIQKKQTQHQLISSTSSTETPAALLLKAERNVPSIVYEKRDLHYQLIDAYFHCGGLNRVLYHKKTFYELFMRKKDTPSPAIYAIAASVLTMRCKHIMDIVPYEQSMQLSDYYFNKSRYAISLQFDEPSLETMITYLHMALFKANIMQPVDAKMYLELALRIRQILSETTFKQVPTFYSAPTAHTHATHTESADVFQVNQHTPIKKIPRAKLVNSYLGEYETFKRLHAGFQDAAHYIQFVNNQRGVPDKNKPKKTMVTEKTRMFQYISAELYNPTPMPDESRGIVRAIMKEHYIARIGKVCGPYFIRVRFGESDMIPLSYLMKTEEDLNHVYFNQIPMEYRLNASIFEDGIDGLEFKKRLAEDGRCDVVSVSIVSRYYQSLIAIHEAYLPPITKPTTPTLVDLSLIQEVSSNDQPQQKKRKRKLQKSMSSGSLSPSSSSSSSEEEEEGSGVLSVHALRAQEICYHSAIKVVRMLEYMCSVLGACTIPLASLLCAWDILMRCSCLGMSEDDMKQSGVSEFLTRKNIQLAQEYAVRCIEVLRRGYMFNGAEHDVWEHYEKMENQLLAALHKSASPTAKYWEPVANW